MAKEFNLSKEREKYYKQLEIDLRSGMLPLTQCIEDFKEVMRDLDEEFIKILKERLLDYQYQTNPQLNEYCHKNIIKQIDKLAGEDLL